MSPLAERLYVASLVTADLTLGTLLYLLGSPVFAGVLCALGLVVAVGRVGSIYAESGRSVTDLVVD